MKLGTIAQVRMGATLRGRDVTRPNPAGAFRLIRIGDISTDGKLATADFPLIRPQEPISKEVLLRNGDVLLANRGTRFVATVYDLGMSQAMVGSQFFILRVDTTLIRADYLAWFLRSDAAVR